MNKVIGFFQVVLVLMFGLLGGQKVFGDFPDLIAQGMLWIEDFPAWQVRTIGVLEVLGALGLVLPHVVKALPKVLVPLAAGGLALTMVGAVITHLVRGDPMLAVGINLTLMGMGIAVAKHRLQSGTERV